MYKRMQNNHDDENKEKKYSMAQSIACSAFGRRQVQVWVFLLFVIPLYFFMFSAMRAMPPTSSEQAVLETDGERDYDTSRFNVGGEGGAQSSSSSERHDSSARKRQVHDWLGYDPTSIPTSKAYQVHPIPQCWNPNCDPYEANNKRAFGPCSVDAATVWNSHGVRNMERLVGGAYEETKPGPGVGSDPNADKHTTRFSTERYINQALWAFGNATRLDDNCAQAFSNYAISLLHVDEPARALTAISRATNLQGNNQYFWAIRGFIEEYNGDASSARNSWNKALEIDPLIGERKYFGIMNVNDTRPERHFLFPTIRSYNHRNEMEVCLKFLTFIEFSKVTVANYANIPVGAQEFFVKNRYYVIRDAVPPYLLHALAKSLESSRDAGIFGKLGDYQAKRYNALNDRSSRTLQFQLVDIWRRIILHNVVPSYVFYGGYQPGAVLPPHTDKPQCEFTISFTVNQRPYLSPWTLSLGSRSKFDRNDPFVGDPQEKMPPNDEVVDADLFAGDALVFMGRHLIHFRTKTLEEGHWVDQLFIHHVQDTFKGMYDI